MIKVGVIGLGMMGSTHLDVYAKRDDVEVVAIADKNPQRLSGEVLAQGNIEGQSAGGFDIRGADVKRFDEGRKLIRSKNVDVVDICLPTPMHVAYARTALKAGKHVLVEKPLGRTLGEARRLVAAAAEADSFIMPAMCMRFWPGWTWAKRAVEESTYGPVRAATFRRTSPPPPNSRDFYLDGARSGGALLDLHIHDIDFIYHLFGMPASVTSAGYTHISGEIDHLTTIYRFDAPMPAMVMAEGGWDFAEGVPFNMTYAIQFEQASAIFDISAPQPLMLYEVGQPPREIPLEEGMGYDHEIDYFIQCVAGGQPPRQCTVQDALPALQIAEAERRSVLSGRPVNIRTSG